MSRLVIASNRVADLRQTTQTGGLAVALADAVRERGGVWFGWDGEIGEVDEPEVDQIDNVTRVALPLSEDDYTNYYLGYANSVLWPLFHYRLDLIDYRPAFFEGYRRVNRMFARHLAQFLKPDDCIWIHDYHLIPLAGYLRELGCRQRMGFFLHIPFPPSDLLEASPNHAELVDWLLQYDLVGLQTHTDVGNLTRYLEDHTPAVPVREGRFLFGERTVSVERFPIGIDFEIFEQMAQRAPDDVAVDVLRRKVLGQKQIIGVDRLDYSKGLPERLRAYGRMLAQHPELEKSVSFLQIAPLTRGDVDAYANIRLELEALAGSINGQFGDFNWTPIRHIHRPVPREKLASLFRASHVGFVTPLRDGMNLVAKEYVAAQDPADPGMLVLSQFAGAAEEMVEALVVNPYDVDEMSRRLHQALVMPRDERRRRHEALMEKVMRHDAKAWLTAFLEALGDLADKPADLS
ncbi:trehalose-6-phosphate synthase [Aquamicrobium sp. LC103]|uniref:alpha,alpha-trehalose-phosphate synthase (UDP-forming) n=1 Tax=Aquamicrobium sp. LC103 TaxID=1120658 RepID=UPI00063E8702|nr:trehalose-6-phosphate synthase [Aquamicrobium sp. LC103]TKT74433.1 trehalose-6-phosphate synthase [Aquamicrobium sp. LC103]